MMVNKNEPVKEHRYCPYCDTEITEATSPQCKPCEVEIFYCPGCREPVPRDKQVCPNCGADIRKEAKEG